MSTVAVSSSSLHQQLQTFFQTRLSDVQQLGQSLQSGDLAGAQQAFNAISQLGQNGPFASGDPFLSSQREQAFTAIGNALQSGNLAGAQQAFATLKSTSRLHGGAAGGSTGAEPPVVILNIGNLTGASSSSSAGATSSSGPTSTAAASASSTAASGPEIVINLGAGNGSSPEQVTLNLSNQANGGEQLTVGVGNQQGANAEQVTLNLSQNEQVVLNLFNATANASSQSNGVSVVA